MPPMRIPIVVLFELCVLVVRSQSIDSAILPAIRNSVTSQHVHIPGTRVFIIPPAGYTEAAAYQGLQRDGNTGVIIYDVVKGNYYGTASSFTPESLEQNGMKVYLSKEISVDGYPAKFIHVQGDIVTKSYNLVFGDSTFSTIVMGFYLNGDKAAERQIIDAFNSIAYDKSIHIDPFDAAFFSFDESRTKYKLYVYSSTIYSYTIGGKDNSDEQGLQRLTATEMTNVTAGGEEGIAGLALQKAGQLGLDSLQVTSSGATVINGYRAYEIIATGRSKGRPAVFYDCVVSNGDKAVAIEATGGKDPDKDLDDFRQLTRTIKMK
jgi:hypothetical protein